MGANRRFFALAQENSILKFTIDTRFINVGATDGSQNSLTYRIPIYYPTSNDNKFIIRVSDGRADVNFVGRSTPATALTLSFATAGIYQITLIGKSNAVVFGGTSANAYDKLKLISIDSFGYDFKFPIANVFFGCTNAWINAPNGCKVLNGRNFFNGIKGFGSNFNLSYLDISESIAFTTMFANVQNSINSMINPFINVTNSVSGLFTSANFASNVNKIEIISPTITNAANLVLNSNLQGEIIIDAPLTSIFQIADGVTNPPILKIDIRRVTSNGNFITTVMSTTNVDATLNHWASLDWTGFTSTLTYNFRNSKYSASSASAKAFLESKGIIFINLTAV